MQRWPITRSFNVAKPYKYPPMIVHLAIKGQWVTSIKIGICEDPPKWISQESISLFGLVTIHLVCAWVCHAAIWYIIYIYGSGTFTTVFLCFKICVYLWIIYYKLFSIIAFSIFHWLDLVCIWLLDIFWGMTFWPHFDLRWYMYCKGFGHWAETCDCLV